MLIEQHQNNDGRSTTQSSHHETPYQCFVFTHGVCSRLFVAAQLAMPRNLRTGGSGFARSTGAAVALPGADGTVS